MRNQTINFIIVNKIKLEKKPSKINFMGFIFNCLLVLQRIFQSDSIRSLIS